MERLNFEECKNCKDWTGSIVDCFNTCGKPLDALEEFNTYKALEEQGKLLKLPCAAGTKVYVIELDEENFTSFHAPRKISEYEFNSQMMGLLELFGRCIFLTREEAEAALKEMRDGRNSKE